MPQCLRPNFLIWAARESCELSNKHASQICIRPFADIQCNVLSVLSMSWKLQALAFPMQDIFNSNVVLTALTSVHYASRWNGAWVTRPERPKGAKDEVKGARRATNKKLGPGGPLNF